MYDKTVTVFNMYESSTAVMWYPHVLHNVDLNTDRGRILQKYGPDSTDNAELHIPTSILFGEDGGSFFSWTLGVTLDGGTFMFEDGDSADGNDKSEKKTYILDSDGNMLLWLPPKEWKRQVNEELPKTITFGPDDFFMLGEWTGGVVDDADYQDRRYNGFYAYMNDRYDFVYLVSSVGGPYTVIPHFEILGK